METGKIRERSGDGGAEQVFAVVPPQLTG